MKRRRHLNRFGRELWPPTNRVAPFELSRDPDRERSIRARRRDNSQQASERKRKKANNLPAPTSSANCQFAGNLSGSLAGAITSCSRAAQNESAPAAPSSFYSSSSWLANLCDANLCQLPRGLLLSRILAPFLSLSLLESSLRRFSARVRWPSVISRPAEPAAPGGAWRAASGEQSFSASGQFERTRLLAATHRAPGNNTSRRSREIMSAVRRRAYLATAISALAAGRPSAADRHINRRPPARGAPYKAPHLAAPPNE